MADAAAVARPGAPTFATTCKLTFEEAVFGVEKEIEFQRHEALRAPVQGRGAEPGTEAVTCPECNGAGELRRSQQSIFGQFVNVSVCGRCQGEGRIITNPCTTCRGTGRTRQTRKIAVKVPAGVDDGAQIRITGEGEAGPRGGGARQPLRGPLASPSTSTSNASTTTSSSSCR